MSDGSFSWEDGSAYNFENWYDGEPNSPGNEGEDCVEMYPIWAGQWNDAYCLNYQQYVCMTIKRKTILKNSQLVLLFVHPCENHTVGLLKIATI